jgi:hypothetical protein
LLLIGEEVSEDVKGGSSIHGRVTSISSRISSRSSSGSRYREAKHCPFFFGEILKKKLLIILVRKASTYEY